MSKQFPPFIIYEIKQTDHVVFELESNHNCSDAVPGYLHVDICMRLGIRNFDELVSRMEQYTKEIIKEQQYIKFEEI